MRENLAENAKLEADRGEVMGAQRCEVIKPTCVLTWAVEALGELKDKRAVKPLIRALKGSEGEPEELERETLRKIKRR
jgi:hypothetical protein